MDGSANPLMDRNVVGVAHFGMIAVITSQTTADCSVARHGVVRSFSCSCSVVVVVVVVVVAVVVAVVLFRVVVVALALALVVAAVVVVSSSVV